ncbi:MAG TPA: hypothetical protein VGG71_00940, partial [Chitinophagaceae bacterium]
MTTIDKVMRFWDSRPCNRFHSPSAVGSRQYYEEVEERKYFVEPHIPAFADFNRWAGKNVLEVGCVDKETEYLSPTGWKSIADYDGGLVMQYHLGGSADFVQPIAYIKRKQKEFLHFKTKYGIDQVLTPDHKVLCWKLKGGDRRLIQTVVTAKDFAEEHKRLKLGNKAKFQTSFSPIISTSLPLTDDQLRVQVMFLADGNIRKNNRKCKLAFVKQRKIDRAEFLLKSANIEFNKKIYGRVTEINFNPPLRVKTYKDFWRASLHQLNVIAEECLNWDGSRNSFYTRDKDSADFIHYVFAATGKRSVMRSDLKKTDLKLDYRIHANSDSMTSMEGKPKSEINNVLSPDGFAYCFNVPSGFLVLRRGGNIFITGNCGIGTDTINFARAGAYVVAVDLSPRSLEIAQQ